MSWGKSFPIQWRLLDYLGWRSVTLQWSSAILGWLPKPCTLMLTPRLSFDSITTDDCHWLSARKSRKELGVLLELSEWRRRGCATWRTKLQQVTSFFSELLVASGLAIGSWTMNEYFFVFYLISIVAGGNQLKNWVIWTFVGHNRKGSERGDC